MKSVRQAVREANRRVFDAKDFDTYDANPSIFEPARQAEIRAEIERAAARGHARILDVGCGTGNVLRLARGAFGALYGVDLGPRLVRELGARHPEFRLAAGEAGQLPFRDGRFDLVSAYGVLHHLADPIEVLPELARVVRPGGVLYVDHDPNYYFGRFFRIYYRLRHLGRPGFGTQEAELSEWHNSRTGGINPDRVRDALARLRFHAIEVRFRLTTNPSLPPVYRALRAVMRSALKVVRWKSLYTHFSVVGVKT